MIQEDKLFTWSEIHNEDNCVFFGTQLYVKSEFEINLTREDFNRFLRRKVRTSIGSGIRTPDIPDVIGKLIKP